MITVTNDDGPAIVECPVIVHPVQPQKQRFREMPKKPQSISFSSLGLIFRSRSVSFGPINSVSSFCGPVPKPTPAYFAGFSSFGS